MDRLNNNLYFNSLKDILTTEKATTAYKMANSDNIKLLSTIDNKIFKYSINNEEISITLKNSLIQNITCSCHNQTFSITNISICDNAFAVILYHLFIKEEEINSKNHKLSSRQREIINKALKTKRGKKITNFDQIMIMTINGRSNDYLSQLFISFESQSTAFINNNIFYLPDDSLNYLLDFIIKSNITLESEVLIRLIINRTPNLSENFVMNNFEYISDIETIKTKNPELFDPLKQSIAFKMFLMMKGV